MIPGFKPHRERFHAFVSSYLIGDPVRDEPYRLKLDHTFRVTAHSLRLSIGLAEPLRLAAALAALYHDLGRFPQLQEFGTFADGNSFNHAFRSIEELERHAFLPEDLHFRSEIIASIRLHNQKRLESPLSPSNDFFYHLLRDCDKTDVLAILDGHYQSAGDRQDILTLGFDNRPHISSPVLSALEEGHIVDLRDVQTLHDFKLLQLGWIFDLHFAESTRYILDKRYFQGILGTIPAQLLPSGFPQRFSELTAQELAKKSPIAQAARAIA